MSGQSRQEAPNPFDPFGAWKQMRDANMDSWSKAMLEFVNSEQYTQATSAALDQYLTMSQPFQRTLEQLMAFTLNPDHERQEQVWDAVKNSWNKEPYAIRRMLTETSVRASDRRAVFVGVDAYEAAGGVDDVLLSLRWRRLAVLQGDQKFPLRAVEVRTVNGEHWIAGFHFLAREGDEQFFNPAFGFEMNVADPGFVGAHDADRAYRHNERRAPHGSKRHADPLLHFRRNADLGES